MIATKNYVEKCFEKGFRADGRKLTEYRNIKVIPNFVERAEGSARIQMGKTDLVVGIKTAVEAPFPDTPEDGNLMVNVELLPLSNARFELGPPGSEATEVARIVDRGVREAKAIDTKKLCIAAGEKVWSVMIDICTINADGNLIDASALGAIVALKNTHFPKYDKEKNEIDYKVKTEHKLPLLAEPIAVTVYKIGNNFIVDPIPEEEEVAEARLTVASTEDGTICAMQKGGDVALTFEEIDAMIGIALDKAKELRELI